MDFLPVFMNLRGARCLVVGGGEVAARKAGVLLDAGARVHLVAPEIADPTRALAETGDVAISERPFAEGDLDGVRLAIAATSVRAVNARVADAAKARGLPVNVVDDPANLVR